MSWVCLVWGRFDYCHTIHVCGYERHTDWTQLKWCKIKKKPVIWTDIAWINVMKFQYVCICITHVTTVHLYDKFVEKKKKQQETIVLWRLTVICTPHTVSSNWNVEQQSRKKHWNTNRNSNVCIRAPQKWNHTLEITHLTKHCRERRRGARGGTNV